MARLDTNFYKAKNEGPLTQTESAVSYYIYKNSPNEDYNELIKNDGRYFIKRAFSDYRQSALRWYPFKKDSCALEIGADFGALTGALCDACSDVVSVEPSFFKAKLVCERYSSRDNLTVYAGEAQEIKFEKKFDYIICFEALEYSSDPSAFLNFFKSLLSKDGVLLIGVENQYGIQYLAGKKDSHSGIPFESLAGYSSQKNYGRGFSRAQLEKIFAKTDFPCWKFYYPMPDVFFPRAIYTDQGLPQENIVERLVVCHEDMSTYVCDDKNLFVDAAANKAFHFVANHFIVELACDKSSMSDAKQMTLSGGYRLRERAFAAIIKEGGLVQKKRLYPEGVEYAERLSRINDELCARGVMTLPMELKGDSFYMEFINEPTVTQYIKLLVDKKAPKDEFFKVFDILWNDIMRSSKTTDECAIDSNGLDLGPILQKAFIEMSVNNSFWLDGKIMYFDQEYVRDNYPAKYVLFRSFIMLTVFIPDFFLIVEWDEIFRRYGMSKDMFDLFWKIEYDLDRQENPYQYSIVNFVDPGAALSNRLKLAGR